MLDLGTALGLQASDVADRRRIAAAEADPSSFAARRTERLDRLDEEELVEDTGLVARFFTNPVAVLTAVAVLGVLVGSRDAWGRVSASGLAPAPLHLGDLWSLQLSSWHAIGLGTAVPAPPFLLPLALVSTLLGGSPTWGVSAMLVASVPLALWGAWRFLRVAGRLATPSGASRWLLLWGATTYALVPVVAGFWGEGRLGPVLAGAVLPWLGHAALGFADPDPDRRWRAAWRTGLLLTVVTAGTPTAWLTATVVGLVVVGLALALLPGIARDRTSWGPPLAALAVVPVLLSPWWVTELARGAGGGLLLDGGRLPVDGADRFDLALGRLADLGAPWWLGLVVPLLALLALLPRVSRIPVLICWVVALLAIVAAAVLAAVRLHLTAVTTAPGLGFPLVAVQAALVTATVLGALGVRGDRADLGDEAGAAPARRRRRVVLGAGLGLIAAVAPVGGLAWFVVTGGGGDLTRDRDFGIPAYMEQSSQLGADHGILVVRGSVESGLTYTVRRGDGLTTGEDQMLALTGADRDFSTALRELATRPTPSAVATLADQGIEYVVLASPADSDVAGSLDATPGLDQASAEVRTTRAWRVDQARSDTGLTGPTSWLHVALLVVQALGLLAVLVLCVPSAGDRRQP